VDKVKQSPEFLEIVLYGGARQDDAVVCGDGVYTLARLGGVLDLVALI